MKNRWYPNGRALMLGALLAAINVGSAQQFSLDSAGGRFGFSPFGAGSHFYQSEVFANFNLPWEWDLGSQWELKSRLDGSLGWLGEADVNAVIGSFGPSLVCRRENLPVSFEAGLSMTGLSRHDFRAKDFGDFFQFTSHAGLNFDVTSRLRFSYRFQHMSNASVSRHNPGLNLHVLGLSYLF